MNTSLHTTAEITKMTWEKRIRHPRRWQHSMFEFSLLSLLATRTPLSFLATPLSFLATPLYTCLLGYVLLCVLQMVMAQPTDDDVDDDKDTPTSQKCPSKTPSTSSPSAPTSSKHSAMASTPPSKLQQPGPLTSQSHSTTTTNGTTPTTTRGASDQEATPSCTTETTPTSGQPRPTLYYRQSPLNQHVLGRYILQTPKRSVCIHFLPLFLFF